MKKDDYAILLALILLAIFIWMRDTAWMSTWDDTLPILIALPLFVWLGIPWQFQEEMSMPSYSTYFAVGALFLLGILTGVTFLLTLGWVLLLWSWLKARTNPTTHSQTKKLLVLPLLAFPWITLDATILGWWFRLSGAYATSVFFTLLGFNVRREGTQLFINQLPVSVELACSGLNTLQAMLIAGTFVAFLFLGNSNRYFWNIPLLILVAWLANTLRIIVLCLAAVFISPEFALGTFHTWGGWLVLMLMFLCCWLFFSWQETQEGETHP